MAEAREVQKLYGLDFTPLLELLARTDPRQFIPPLEDGDRTLFKPRILSEECLLVDLDLRADNLDRAGEPAEVRLRIRSPGTLGGLAVYFRAHLDETIQLANAPLAPMTSWGRPLRHLSRRVQVAPGDEVGLQVKLRSRRGREYLDVDLV